MCNKTRTRLIAKLSVDQQETFKSCNHDVYTEKVNKTAMSSNDDRRI